MRQFNTLTGFLLSKSSNPTTDDTVTFEGYSAIGDGGAATWKHNGVTGQTPSQSPAQLGDGLLNDGNGNQWGFVGTTINIAQVGDAVQAAINGANISVITGDINTVVNTSAFIVPSNKKLTGLNLKYSGAGSEDFISTIPDDDNISISGCIIDASGADDAVRAFRNNNFTLSRNEIHGCSASGLQITGTGADTDNENLLIEYNNIHDTGDKSLEVRSSLNGRIINNNFKAWGVINNSSNAIQLQEVHENLFITGNTLTNTVGDLFGIESAGDNARIKNSKISNNIMIGSFTGISGKIEHSEVSDNQWESGNGSWRSGIELIGSGNSVLNNIVPNGSISIASNGDGSGSNPSINSNDTFITGNKIKNNSNDGRCLLVGAVATAAGIPTSHNINIKDNVFDMSESTGTGIRCILVGEYTNESQLSNVNIVNNTIIGNGESSTEGVRILSLAGGGTVNVKTNTITDVGKGLRINNDGLSRVNYKYNDVSQNVPTEISDISTTTVVQTANNDT